MGETGKFVNLDIDPRLLEVAAACGFEPARLGLQNRERIKIPASESALKFGLPECRCDQPISELFWAWWSEAPLARKGSAGLLLWVLHSIKPAAAICAAQAANQFARKLDAQPGELETALGLAVIEPEQIRWSIDSLEHSLGRIDRGEHPDLPDSDPAYLERILTWRMLDRVLGWSLNAPVKAPRPERRYEVISTTGGSAFEEVTTHWVIDQSTGEPLHQFEGITYGSMFADKIERQGIRLVKIVGDTIRVFDWDLNEKIIPLEKESQEIPVLSPIPEELKPVTDHCPRCGSGRVGCTGLVFDLVEMTCFDCGHSESLDEYQLKSWKV